MINVTILVNDDLYASGAIINGSIVLNNINKGDRIDIYILKHLKVRL